MTTTLYRNLQKLNETLAKNKEGKINKPDYHVLVTFHQSAADKGIVAGNHTGKDAESNDQKNVRKIGPVKPEPLYALTLAQAKRLGFGDNAASIFKEIDDDKYCSDLGIDFLKHEAKEHINQQIAGQSQASRFVVRQQLRG